MRLAPSAQIFRHSAQIGYILVIFFASAELPPRSSVTGYFLYISDMPDLIPRSISRKSAAFRYFSWNRHLPLTRARGAKSAKHFYINGLFKSFQTVLDTQMYLE